MGWLSTPPTSSIGKKGLMAASGLVLTLFLTLHLIGNSTAFWGSAAMNNFAERLHRFEVFLFVLEIGLLLTFAIHITIGLLLFRENCRARPQPYAVTTASGGRTPGSRTMPYTGLMILGFLLVHMANIQIAGHGISTAALVRHLFRQPGYALLYLIAIIAVTLHISHGCWSLFQSIGLSHPRYDAMLRQGAILFSITVGTVFGLLPVLMLFSDRFLR